MKVLIVSDILREEVNNGTDIATMNLINYLKSRGDDVRILCADQARKGTEGFYICPTLKLPFINNYILENGVILAKADKKVMKEAIAFADHVHIMIALHLGIKAGQMAHKMGKPVTVGFHMQAQNFTAHICMERSRLVNKLFYVYIYRHLFRYVDGIHYPTKFIQNIFERSIHKKTNGYVISNGINDYVIREKVEKLPEFKDKFVILSTGRYSKEKSQITLLRAVNKSKNKDKIHVILAGQGPLVKKYERYARRHKISHTFKFYERKEIVDILNMADLYVHPAIMELEGIAALEAMCVGKCTLVTNSKYAAPKLFSVDKECIFKQERPKRLALKIDELMANPAKIKELEDKYYNNRVYFDLANCMNQMGKMIDEVYTKHQGKK